MKAFSFFPSISLTKFRNFQEDISEWFETLLDPEKFPPEEILTILQTGIVACKVATRLCHLIANDIKARLKFQTEVIILSYC